MLIVTFVASYVVQRTTVGFTYFRPSGTPCEPYYDLTFPRWFYLIWITVSFIDVKMGYGVGHKIWKRIALVFSGAAAFAHIVVFAVCIFFFITTCNAPGSGVIGNICNSRRFCGVPPAIADANNQCQYVNPTGKPLMGYTTLDDLTWDNDFVMFFIFQAIYTFFAIVKFVAGALLSGAVEALYGGITGAVSSAKRVFNALDDAKSQDNNDKIEELEQEEAEVDNAMNRSKKKNPALVALRSQLEREISTLTASSATIVRNLASEMKFFDVFTPLSAFLYVFAIFMETLVTLGLIAWFGWFQQNVDSFREIWRETTPISGFSEYVLQENTANFIFYGLLTFNIITISFMTFLGDIYTNIGSILAAGLGFLVNLGLLGYTVVFHMRQCNVNGVPYNPCTNLRGTYMAFALNPANDVAYAATCVAPFAPLPGPNYPWDPSYVYFVVMMLVVVGYYSYVLVLSIGLEWTFRRRVQDAEKPPDVATLKELTSMSEDVDSMESGSQMVSEAYVQNAKSRYEQIMASASQRSKTLPPRAIIVKHRTLFTDISDFTKYVLFRTEPQYSSFNDKKSQ